VNVGRRRSWTGFNFQAHAPAGRSDQPESSPIPDQGLVTTRQRPPGPTRRTSEGSSGFIGAPRLSRSGVINPRWTPVSRRRISPRSPLRLRPMGQVGGLRTCSLPASLEDVGVGPWRTNRAGQSLNNLSETAAGTSLGQPARRKSPLQDPRGARPRAAGQTPPGTRRLFIVVRSGEGGTEAGTTPGRTWATPTQAPHESSRTGRRRMAQCGFGHGPTTPGLLPGWRAH
jgi:hypothetical protein